VSGKRGMGKERGGEGWGKGGKKGRPRRMVGGGGGEIERAFVYCLFIVCVLFIWLFIVWLFVQRPKRKKKTSWDVVRGWLKYGENGYVSKRTKQRRLLSCIGGACHLHVNSVFI
jgi:hypothetical protein